MSNNKKRRRGMVRAAALKRDKHRCVVCKIAVGELGAGQKVPCPALDPHHITPRTQMPNGGYVVENIVTLCPTCHNCAESWLNNPRPEPGFAPYTPGALYKAIGSSYEKALAASEKLS